MTRTKAGCFGLEFADVASRSSRPIHCFSGDFEHKKRQHPGNYADKPLKTGCFVDNMVTLASTLTFAHCQRHLSWLKSDGDFQQC